MVIKHHVEGYENFRRFIDNFDSKGQVVHVYFCGSKLENGESWCDDCERGKICYVLCVLSFEISWSLGSSPSVPLPNLKQILQY